MPLGITVSMESVVNAFGIKLIRAQLNLATTLLSLIVASFLIIMSAVVFVIQDTFKFKVNASDAHKTHSMIELLMPVFAIQAIILLESKY